jgi:hypothetical protein
MGLITASSVAMHVLSSHVASAEWLRLQAVLILVHRLDRCSKHSDRRCHQTSRAVNACS